MPLRFFIVPPARQGPGPVPPSGNCAVQDTVDHGFTADFQQWFGAIIRQRTQTLAQPGGICNVRVIDVVNKQRLFPVASDDPNAPPSHQLRVIARRVGSPAVTGGTSQLQMYELLSFEMGSQLARLFYEHNVEKLGQNLKTR